ncbi:MAG: tetratricopeptide repeat protein [Vicinamibacteria bacterium]
MRVRCRSLTLVVVASAALPLPAQPAGDRTLAELAKGYRTGDRELAVAALGLRSRESVESEAQRLAGLFSDAGLAGDAQRAAAVVLLSESALRDLDVGAFRRVPWKLQSAARLAAAAPPATSGSLFDRRFHLLAGLALHAAGELEPGHAVLLAGSQAATNDPELHTALGAVIETVATLREYDPSPDSKRGRPRRGGYASESGGRGSLSNATLADAQARYERALEIDPELTEARLRLGRARLLRGRPAEALRELERVAAEARQPAGRYLARLFEARALEALGDLRGAAAACRAATLEVPRAQAGLLALGRALDRLGDTAGAQEAFERASAPGGPEDPWLDYRSGQPARLEGLLEELRSLLP